MQTRSLFFGSNAQIGIALCDIGRGSRDIGDTGSHVGDPGLIRIALVNLLGNAWKYTAKVEHAVITLCEVSRSGNRVEFLISDNGAGFDNAHAKQLFMPFRR